MAYEDINDRYAKSYAAKKSTLEAAQQGKMTDLQNQEADINNRYNQLLDSFTRNRNEGQQNFYNQRNQSDVVNAQNAQKINQLAQARGWTGGELAQMNLDQNAQRTNALGAITGQENKYMGDLTAQQLNAQRDNAMVLNQLANNRNLAKSQYDLGLYGAQQENEANKLAEIYQAMQTEKQRQWEAQQAALQQEFQKQMQREQIAAQNAISEKEYNYKTAQQSKTSEKDQTKDLNDYWNSTVNDLDGMAKMNMSKQFDENGNEVGTTINDTAKKAMYNRIMNDPTLVQSQKQELIDRYGLAGLQPQPQQQQQISMYPSVQQMFPNAFGKPTQSALPSWSAPSWGAVNEINNPTTKSPWDQLLNIGKTLTQNPWWSR